MYATPVSKREKRPAKEKTDLFCRKNLENILHSPGKNVKIITGMPMKRNHEGMPGWNLFLRRLFLCRLIANHKSLMQQLNPL